MKGYKPGITKKDIEAHKRTNEKVRRTDTMNKALEKAKGGKKKEKGDYHLTSGMYHKEARGSITS